MAIRTAQVRPDGSVIRWVELPGAGPARVFLHGLGASSPPYYASVAARPELAGRRTLLLDLLGFGISDRPADAGYTLAEHAGWVAAALRAAGVTGAEIVAHSMSGAIGILLAARCPELVGRLVLVDSNLDPAPPVPQPGSSGIARYTEDEFLHGGGREAVLDRVGPHWAATMRLAGPEALYRSAADLARFDGRATLHALTVPRTYLYPAADGAPDRVEELAAHGVRIVEVPDSGHNIMLDNPDALVAELSLVPVTATTSAADATAATEAIAAA